MKKAILVGFLTLCLCSCATIPGSVNVSKSDFDNSTQILTKPGWVGASGYVRLGLMWNSKMKADVFKLDVMVANSGVISIGESLHFNIDGKVINLTSDDEKTTTTIEPPVVSQFYSSPGAVWAAKTYNVPAELIGEIVSAKRVAWRLDLGKEYREGVLEDGMTTAVSGFKDFMAEYTKYNTGI